VASLTLTLLPDHLAVCRLPSDAPFPSGVCSKTFLSVTRTSDELSIVCDADSVPPDARSELGWRCFKVAGPLDFALVGVLASLAGALAEAGVSVYAISTFDTDYLLVKAEAVSSAVEALRTQGHAVLLDGGEAPPVCARSEESSYR
jgi:hypothetical protein